MRTSPQKSLSFVACGLLVAVSLGVGACGARMATVVPDSSGGLAGAPGLSGPCAGNTSFQVGSGIYQSTNPARLRWLLSSHARGADRPACAVCTEPASEGAVPWRSALGGMGDLHQRAGYPQRRVGTGSARGAQREHHARPVQQAGLDRRGERYRRGRDRYTPRVRSRGSHAHVDAREQFALAGLRKDGR